MVIDLSNIVQLEGRHGGEKKEGELMKKKDEFGNVIEKKKIQEKVDGDD